MFAPFDFAGAAEQGGDSNSEAFALVSQSCPWVSEAEAAAGGEGQGEGDPNEEVAAMERRIAELNEEKEQISRMQSEVERQIGSVAGGIEENSIYVGQVN